MKDEIYPYERVQGSRYTFISVGRRKVIKQVVFTYTGIRHIVNMGFGDVQIGRAHV